jgi:predicted RNase H-like HicB family nuclease
MSRFANGRMARDARPTRLFGNPTFPGRLAFVGLTMEPSTQPTWLSHDKRGHIMKTEFTAIIKRDGDWWLGWIEELPGANAQERTKEELLISLREAARDILELRREEARRGGGFN